MKDVVTDATRNPPLTAESPARKDLRRLRKVAFYVKYRGSELGMLSMIL